MRGRRTSYFERSKAHGNKLKKSAAKHVPTARNPAYGFSGNSHTPSDSGRAAWLMWDSRRDPYTVFGREYNKLAAAAEKRSILHQNRERDGDRVTQRNEKGYRRRKVTPPKVARRKSSYFERAKAQGNTLLKSSAKKVPVARNSSHGMSGGTHTPSDKGRGGWLLSDSKRDPYSVFGREYNCMAATAEKQDILVINRARREDRKKISLRPRNMSEVDLHIGFADAVEILPDQWN